MFSKSSNSLLAANVKVAPHSRSIFLLGLLAALSMAGYLWTSRAYYRTGFPLDDAWIHQTYARNLATSGEWAFLPGVPSGGSTGPLWGAMLALGHLVGLGPYVWTFLLGWLALWSLGVVGMQAIKILCPQFSGGAVWGGALLVVEWHLVWAAASGMETLLFALVATYVLVKVLIWDGEGFYLGALIGLSVWLRPEGLTLVGPAAWAVCFGANSFRHGVRIAVKMALGMAVFLLPYLFFNLSLTGSWWPNTYFAKQAEYQILRRVPYLTRWFHQAALPLIGVGVALLPGFFLSTREAFRGRKWIEIGCLLWLVGYLALYAWRLPVTYQHGRYVMPVMPFFFIYSFAGMLSWLAEPASLRWQGVLKRTWIGSALGVLLAFWFLGAKAYAQDVAIIESEMVATAHWVADNTSPDTRIAAHDIGALGYWGGREIIDLAGLITPDVVSFIRDEARLKAYLDARGTDYLVTFPGWYPDLVRDLSKVFQTEGAFSPAAGGENMAVYRWPVSSHVD